MQKAHQNINWENLPSTNTPLNQTNLNSMDQAIDVIDDRVVAFDTSKANESDMLISFKNITFNQATGTFTFTRFNNTTVEVDTGLEKMAVNFDYDDDPTSAHYQQLIITLEDGTVKYVDMSALITQYEFQATPTINPVISGGKVQMNIINGSITGEKLQPDYLADITVQAQDAAASAQTATAYATESESWAVGGTGTREDEDTDNSKYYADQAAEKVAELLQAFGVSVVQSILVFGSTFLESFDLDVSGTTLVISNLNP